MGSGRIRKGSLPCSSVILSVVKLVSVIHIWLPDDPCRVALRTFVNQVFFSHIYPRSSKSHVAFNVRTLRLKPGAV